MRGSGRVIAKTANKFSTQIQKRFARQNRNPIQSCDWPSRDPAEVSGYISYERAAGTDKKRNQALEAGEDEGETITPNERASRKTLWGSAALQSFRVVVRIGLA
jgi:hypothetical protein